MNDLAVDVRMKIRDVPDFPRPGILFKDLTPVLADPALFERIIDWFASDVGPVDRIVGMESRGFWFGCPLVNRLGAGFVPLRKPGKLPWETRSASYELEYGTATLQVHQDAIEPGMRVLVVDDLLATGGTASAALELVRRLGGHVVAASFLVELCFLEGRARMDCPVRSLVSY